MHEQPGEHAYLRGQAGVRVSSLDAASMNAARLA